MLNKFLTQVSSAPTKREILAKLAKVYDPSAWRPPLHCEGTKSTEKRATAKYHVMQLSQRI